MTSLVNTAQGRLQGQTEDCLFLNIWTAGLDDAKRPVMVWIRAGGLTIGSGSETYYNGSNLAAAIPLLLLAGWLIRPLLVDESFPFSLAALTQG